MSEQFAKLMQQFGRFVGLETVTPDEHNNCVLGIDNFVVTISLQDATVLVYAPVGTLGASGREKVLLRLLRGNYFFAETGGATLGVSPLNDEIQLLYREHLQNLDATSLTALVETFLERLEYWHGVCAEASEPSDSGFGEAGLPQGVILG